MTVAHPERALYLPQSPVVVSGGEAFAGDVLVNAAPDSRLSPPTTKDSGRRQPVHTEGGPHADLRGLRVSDCSLRIAQR